jgi:hypothetical protein
LETTVVPGHGNVVDAGFVAQQQVELEEVAEIARRGHRDTAPLEFLTDSGPYPEATMRQALTRAYAQLDGEL